MFNYYKPWISLWILGVLISSNPNSASVRNEIQLVKQSTFVPIRQIFVVQNGALPVKNVPLPNTVPLQSISCNIGRRRNSINPREEFRIKPKTNYKHQKVSVCPSKLLQLQIHKWPQVFFFLVKKVDLWHVPREAKFHASFFRRPN